MYSWRFRKYVLIYLLILISFPPELAKADSCDQTLVLSTLRDSRQLNSDRRLALLIDRENYSAIKRSGETSAVVYGIPMGAGYEQFSENRQRVFASFAESHRIDVARDVAWTGLDPQASNLYVACQQARIATSNGIFLIVSSATAQNYIVMVLRRLPREHPDDRVEWQPPVIQTQQGAYSLSTSIGAGMTQISLPRPVADTAVLINYAGFTSQPIVLRPPAPPIQPPTARPATRAVTVTGIAGAYDVAAFDDAPGKLRLTAKLRARQVAGGPSFDFGLRWGVVTADGEFSPQAKQEQTYMLPAGLGTREHIIDLNLQYVPAAGVPRTHLPMSARVVIASCHENHQAPPTSRSVSRDASVCEVEGTLSVTYD